MRACPIQGAGSVKGKGKPPVPGHHHKFVTVPGCLKAGRMQTALRQRLGSPGLTFFAVCRQTGGGDGMGDSGRDPLERAALRNARAVAAEIKKT